MSAPWRRGVPAAAAACGCLYSLPQRRLLLLLQPGVCQHLCSGGALRWVEAQHGQQEVAELLGLQRVGWKGGGTGG